MNERLRIDWIGFVLGVGIGLIVWLFVHEQSYRLGKDKPVAVPQVRQESALPAAATATSDSPSNGGGNAPVLEEAVKKNAEERQPSASLDKKAEQAEALRSLERLKIKVYLTEEKRVESVSLEQYVRGVVAAELPLEFEPAAMEAQALAARTYIVRRLLLEDRTGIPETGAASEADVTDTVSHQVYKSLKEMQELKQSNEQGWNKVNLATLRTKGRVIVYEGEPIEALYFASSNGHTENSEEVFGTKLPYLRSVDSPWDRTEASDWVEKSTFSLAEFYRKMGVGSVAAVAGGAGKSSIRILDLTDGGRVKELLVGDERIPGKTVREKLGLRSAAFTLKQDKRGVHITTYGSGHGVGMSQWGAEGMAEQGMRAEEIIEYYYKGVQLAEASDWLPKLPL
ncbi:stage II sporulation protein D [Cohnella thailandensis]|uniref:Stage II sporulation protein D n=1 Tax=Cohnella thailandensis TaxID=557557 RepID=A0A841T118_9BACL|nr:stage II sporulation protein D [Cohnella thailandensis]MBB6638113.1 stage II sporulation protein D [Cohnella thailandensis]MBP1971960.1 stage II sporulation protein D [Cohnella thailandensis]